MASVSRRVQLRLTGLYVTILYSENLWQFDRSQEIENQDSFDYKIPLPHFMFLESQE